MATIEPLHPSLGAESDHLPPVRHPLVRRHSATGEPALFIGSHLREIEGLEPKESNELIAELTVHTTRAEAVHTHMWRPFDLIVWDNSAVLHRGKPWDETEPRHLVRATVADDGFAAGELAAA